MHGLDQVEILAGDARDHVLSVQRRLVDVVDKEEQADDLPDHLLVVELAARGLQPGAQKLEQVRQ